MTIRPHHLSVGRLFIEHYIFTVPRYQRSYTWDDPEIEDFLRDLQKCYDSRVQGTTRHHFFGGMVSVDRQVPGSACEILRPHRRSAAYRDIRHSR